MFLSLTVRHKRVAIDFAHAASLQSTHWKLKALTWTSCKHSSRKIISAFVLAVTCTLPHLKYWTQRRYTHSIRNGTYFARAIFDPYYVLTNDQTRRLPRVSSVAQKIEPSRNKIRLGVIEDRIASVRDSIWMRRDQTTIMGQ